MSIPLVQNNDKDAINTSIIAIKRNIERINMLLGLSNSEEIDTSEFVKKSDIVDVVEAGNMNPVTSNAVVPVDEVTLGNMHSVTSNSVAESLSYSETEFKTGGKWIDGKPIYRKVITKTSWQYQTYITNVLNNPDTVLSFNFNIIDTSSDRVYSGNLTSSIPSYITEIYYIRSSNRLYYTGGADRAILNKCIFIFEYTKTTD